MILCLIDGLGLRNKKIIEIGNKIFKNCKINSIVNTDIKKI